MVFQKGKLPYHVLLDADGDYSVAQVLLAAYPLAVEENNPSDTLATLRLDQHQDLHYEGMPHIQSRSDLSGSEQFIAVSARDAQGKKCCVIC